MSKGRTFTWAVVAVCGLLLIFAMLSLFSVYQTCSKCGSVRRISALGPRLVYKAPSCATCAHSWELGHHLGVDSIVKDGTIVLVRKGNTYGAFIPRSQRMSPDNSDFDWYYRTDGKGTFRQDESARFRKGRSGLGGQGDRPFDGLVFGPFSVGWSGHTDGEGYIYYEHFAGEKIEPDCVRVCVTGERDITKIDAADPKWLYKGSPSDSGVRGH